MRSSKANQKKKVSVRDHLVRDWLGFYFSIKCFIPFTNTYMSYTGSFFSRLLQNEWKSFSFDMVFDMCLRWIKDFSGINNGALKTFHKISFFLIRMLSETRSYGKWILNSKLRELTILKKWKWTKDGEWKYFNNAFEQCQKNRFHFFFSGRYKKCHSYVSESINAWSLKYIIITGISSHFKCFPCVRFNQCKKRNLFTLRNGKADK